MKRLESFPAAEGGYDKLAVKLSGSGAKQTWVGGIWVHGEIFQ
jgi:hypothetical protein